MDTGHTTVGITVNEPDSDRFHDLLNLFDAMVPPNRSYTHPANSDSHLKAARMGGSAAVPISDGKLELGTWQAVLLCEFDGPRTRTVRVRIVGT